MVPGEPEHCCERFVQSVQDEKGNAVVRGVFDSELLVLAAWSLLVMFLIAILARVKLRETVYQLQHPRTQAGDITAVNKLGEGINSHVGERELGADECAHVYMREYGMYE